VEEAEHDGHHHHHRRRHAPPAATGRIRERESRIREREGRIRPPPEGPGKKKGREGWIRPGKKKRREGQIRPGCSSAWPRRRAPRLGATDGAAGGHGGFSERG